MHEEGPVADLADGDVWDLGQLGDDRVGVLRVDASQVTSTTSRSAWDSATSSAVRTPSAVLTVATKPPVAPEEEGVSTRTVIAYPGLGVAMLLSLASLSFRIADIIIYVAERNWRP